MGSGLFRKPNDHDQLQRIREWIYGKRATLSYDFFCVIQKAINKEQKYLMKFQKKESTNPSFLISFDQFLHSK